jgi:hypothetical protein
MLDKIFKAVRHLLASAERDRLEAKFEKINTRFSDLEGEFDNRFTGVDSRLDEVEKHQAAQNEKLNAIHQVTLANNEALEQRLNLSVVSSDMVRQIVDARIDGFQSSMKNIQSLIEQLIRRDCNN